MGVMKENLFTNPHDTTFSPTGLYNFVSGNIGADSSGNDPAKNLTEAELDSGDPTDDIDFIGGSAEGLSHFTLYRNDSSDFNYTGSMTYCCLMYTTASIADSPNAHAVLGICRGGANGNSFSEANDQRWALQLNNQGHIRYAHIHNMDQGSGNHTLHLATSDKKVREHHTWNHVAFTRDSLGTLVKIYFNGEELTLNLQKYVGGAYHSLTGSRLEHAPETTGTAYFAVGDIYNYRRSLTNTVSIASCAIYDQELTANQIKYLAKKTLGYRRVK